MISIKHLLNKSMIYKRAASLFHQIVVKIDPSYEMCRIYKATFHKTPNLIEPKDLIEKIYWLQLHTDTSMWTLCADKYLLRSYVKQKGYEEYMPTLYAKWDRPEDISFEQLPNSFILKTNNGCAQGIIIKDSNSADEKSIRLQFKKWLSIPYGYAGAQLHYTRIKPCIIAEELLLSSKEDKKISPNSLIDYKVWCFNGKPESIFVATNRRKGNYIDISLYDLNWLPIPQYLRSTKIDRYNPNVKIPKPCCLDEMLGIATELALPFPEVRVDFYVINKKPVIGELTFTTGYGYFSEEYYQYLGSKIDLSKVERIR